MRKCRTNSASAPRTSTNATIVRIEEQLQPIELKKLTDLLLLKSKQIEEHDKLKPAEVAVPTEAMSPEQKQAAEGLAAASQQVDAARKRSQEIAGETTELAKRQKAIGNIREQLRLLQRAFDQAEKTVSDDLNLLGFAWSDLAAIDIKTAVLEEKSTELATKQGEIKIEAEKLAEVEVIVKDLSAAWENHCCGEPNRDVINQLIEKLEGMFEGDE